MGSLYGNVFVTFKEEEMVLPMRSAVVKDENGHVCTTTESQHRQRRHFNNILNVQSGFDMEELETVTQRQLKPEMAELPTEDELLNAIKKVKNGRAGGESSILPEMVKAACIGYTFSKTLLELVHDVWEKRSVPDDWRDAMLIPIPKKGDLSHCDNWRRISQLTVIRKIVARILQERLQKLQLRTSYLSHSVALGKEEAVQT